jgi:hypothetical protein
VRRLWIEKREEGIVELELEGSSGYRRRWQIPMLSVSNEGIRGIARLGLPRNQMERLKGDIPVRIFVSSS